MSAISLSGAPRRAVTLSKLSRRSSAEECTMSENKANKQTVKVRLVKSIAGTKESHRATVRGLGLRKLNSESELEDTPAVRGMINKVSYLLKGL